MSVCYRPPGNETLLSWKTSRATGTAFLLLAALLGLPGNGFVVKLKLQYFGHGMQRVDSFDKTLMMGKIEGRRRMG